MDHEQSYIHEQMADDPEETLQPMEPGAGKVLIDKKLDIKS